MKKILVATNNRSKLELYKNILNNIVKNEIICLKDINLVLSVEEPFDSERENAIYKAKEYSKASGCVVICDDTGLYFKGVPDSIQPKTKVSRINGEKASDEEIIAYYKTLVEKYGYEKDGVKFLDGFYLKTIALGFENNIKCFQYKVHKLFTNKVLSQRNIGFPLDSMSITPEFNKYTVELTNEDNFKLMEITNSQVLDFFKENIKVFQ